MVTVVHTQRIPVDLSKSQMWTSPDLCLIKVVR